MAKGELTRIFKYGIDFRPTQKIEMPRGAEIIHVEKQEGSGCFCCIWAIVNPSEPDEVVEIEIIGTGQPFPKLDDAVARRHLATLVMGSFVWHLFRRVEVGHEQ